MKLTCTLRLIEETLTAAAFAEENEHETARVLLRRREAAEQKAACLCTCGGEPRFGALLHPERS